MDASPVEIERKFLASEIPGEPDRLKSERIEQGYLCAGDESEVRLRRIGKIPVLTVKRGAGAKRLELEVELTEEQFQGLWGGTAGARLIKRRYYVPVGEETAEVDVYEEHLEGLITVEVEFRSLDCSEAFAPPEWFGV